MSDVREKIQRDATINIAAKYMCEVFDKMAV